MLVDRSLLRACAALLLALVLVPVWVAGPAAAAAVVHQVQRGDSLYSIARRYGVSIAALVQENQIADPDRLSVGMQLVIPSGNLTHEVARGETLSGIAQKYGVDVQELASANDIVNPHRLQVGQRLVIPGRTSGTSRVAAVSRSGEAAPAEDPDEPITHKVASGDTLWELAQRHGTTPQAIAASSGIAVTSTLQVGQILTIPAAGAGVQTTGARAIPWREVHRMFRVGETARVTDVDTGLTFEIVRRGGTNHADCEPLTANDTATMRRIWGGWSWDRRAIVVEFDGHRVAASMHAMPHGRDTVAGNRFPGHFCVHFLNSMTHGSAYTASGVPQRDPQHQAMVRKAIGK
jgi:LysM repeat protein